jgi:ankyrin repeat protein
MAAALDNAKLVIVLLNRGADVHPAEDRDGDTALYITCLLNRYNTARLLVSRDADVMMEDNDAITPRDLVSNEKERQSLLLYRYSQASRNWKRRREVILFLCSVDSNNRLFLLFKCLQHRNY